MPSQSHASTEGKTKFLPLVTDGGRVTLAPVVKWEKIGEAFGKKDPPVERRELLEKAAALRELAADLIAQAEGIEAAITHQSDAQSPGVNR